MSTVDVLSRLRGHSQRAAASRRTIAAALFGDRVGLTVFLGCLCLFSLAWQTTIFITDTYTIANGLYSLSNGEWFLTEAVYGPGLDTPGAEPSSGGLIARNYGVIALSLPYVYLLEALQTVTELRIGLIAVWTLVALAFAVQLSRLVGDDRVAVTGSVVALGLFGLNVALATPLDTGAIHLYALQLFHLTVAAFAPVLLYRLLGRIHTRRIGLLGAVVFVFGTPLALWASVPKRHAITGTIVVAVAYCLSRSRSETEIDGANRSLRFRAAAYAAVGLYAWVHAPEALLICLALAVVDVPTAQDNSPRTLAVIGAAFLLSLLPFFVTNTVVAGSPLRPPRLLAVTHSASSGGAAAGGSSGAIGGSGGGTGGSLLAPLFDLAAIALGPAAKLIQPVTILLGELATGLSTLITRPDGAVHTFIRSGWAKNALSLDNEAANLSLLESAPLFAALVGVLPTALRRLRARAGLWPTSRILSAARVTDCFVVVLFVGIALQYISRLPVHAQVTVRYLFPLYPLGVYLLIRIPVVRDTLAGHWRAFGWSLAGTVLVGGQLVVVAVALTAASVGEAFQLHALLALTTAAPLGIWALRGRADDLYGRLGAISLGVATGVITLFVALTVLSYYPLGDSHALPMVRALARLLDLV